MTRNNFGKFENLVNILGTVFWFHINCELFMFLPLGCDMWLPGDYPARYYSLCDTGILAPIFVMVISSGFVSADEFWFCVDDWVLALCRRLSCGLGLDFLVLEWCYYCSQYILCSFTLRYFKKVLCYTVLIILFIL